MAVRAGTLAVLVSIALCVGALSGPATAAPSESQLADSSCFLLFVAGAGGAVSGEDGSHQVGHNQLATACTYLSCWTRVQAPDGTSQCQYARGDTLTINAEPSAKASRRLVKKFLAKGFDRVKVHADLAAIGKKDNGYMIVMAVHKSAALLLIGPASDTDTSPSWPGVKQEAISEAKEIARRLKHRGCPADYHQCKRP